VRNPYPQGRNKPGCRPLPGTIPGRVDTVPSVSVRSSRCVLVPFETPHAKPGPSIPANPYRCRAAPFVWLCLPWFLYAAHHRRPRRSRQRSRPTSIRHGNRRPGFHWPLRGISPAKACARRKARGSGHLERFKQIMRQTASRHYSCAWLNDLNAAASSCRDSGSCAPIAAR